MGVEFTVLMGEVLSRSVLTNLLLSFSFIDEAQPLYEKKMSGKFWGRASYNFHSGLKVPRGLFYILFLSGFFYVTENLRDLVQRTTCVHAEGPALTQQKKGINCRMWRAGKHINCFILLPAPIVEGGLILIILQCVHLLSQKKIYYLIVMFLNLTPQPPFLFLNLSH